MAHVLERIKSLLEKQKRGRHNSVATRHKLMISKASEIKTEEQSLDTMACKDGLFQLKIW